MEQLELDFSEWKPLYNFENIAEININGDIRTVDRYVRNSNNGTKRLVKGQLLKQQTTDRYLYVHINKDNKNINVYIHKALYSTFIQPIPKGYDIHHKNHIRTDNRLENLEMVSKEEHSKIHQKERINASRNVCIKPVMQYTLDGDFIAEYTSVIDAEKATGIYHSTISNVCVNRTSIDKNGYKHTCKTAGGYIWRYKETAA